MSRLERRIRWLEEALAVGSVEFSVDDALFALRDVENGRLPGGAYPRFYWEEYVRQVAGSLPEEIAEHRRHIEHPEGDPRYPAGLDFDRQHHTGMLDRLLAAPGHAVILRLLDGDPPDTVQPAWRPFAEAVAAVLATTEPDDDA